MKLTKRLMIIMFTILSIFAGSFISSPVFAEDDKTIQWLEDHSMLNQANAISRKYSGSKKQWENPYALPQSKRISSAASVWFTCYPASTITRQGENIIQTFADEATWKAFQEIGIEALHTGPMERAGGVSGTTFTPTVDGGFDRIGIDIDPTFGTNEDFKKLSQIAHKHGAMIAGDIVPGHTGKGPDFRLAERNYKDFPGLYNMIEIQPEDWNILPTLPDGKDSINLKPEVVKELIKRKYACGTCERVIFYEKGVKETNWSVTGVIRGVDGKDRRWIYLHYFKEGQPTLNWLDPSSNAIKLIAGDIINSVENLGTRIVRLDANGFLGIEPTPGSECGWSEGHPLSVMASNMIAMLVRKLGGYTFQELNLTLEDIKKFSAFGADLSYDFVTRPAYLHALITGDAEFLRLMLQQQRKYQIDPSSLIHALQNHDEITYELVHFNAHKTEKFPFHGKTVTGGEYRVLIRNEAEAVVVKPVTYNLVTCNGICSTMTGIAAASLGIKDPYKMTDAEKARVKKAHLLLAMYNAMQPGVMALSGWDLVGALPLPAEQVKPLLADGDNRWINRGSYDLMGYNPTADKSASGLPKAVCLYGPLPEQLKDKNSFASQLKHMLQVRKKYKINLAAQVAIPAVTNPGVVVMVHQLPNKGGIEVTALNFGRKAVEEKVKISQIKGLQGMELLTGSKDAAAAPTGEVALKLDALSGKVLLFKK